MTVYAYGVYLALSFGFTIWVARTLFRNGRVFLVDTFAGNEVIADAVNHLLIVGFYLLNLGTITLTLASGDKPTTLTEGIEFVSTKLGLALIILGIIHFFNLFIFSRMRKRALLRQEPPPVTPDVALTGSAA